MFDAIGLKGRVKRLSPLRWLVSWGLTAAGVIGLVLAEGLFRSPPKAAAKNDEGPEVIVFTAPKAPLPPVPVPKRTTHPDRRRPQVTRKVVTQVIEDPLPTPIPEQLKKQDDETPTPEVDLDFDGFGNTDAGAIGILGQMLSDRLGSASQGGVNIQEVSVQNIKKTTHVAPVYPALAKRANAEGEVLIEVTCRPDGAVSEIRWLRGNRIFEEAVRSAVMQWRFAPRPISFKFQQPMSFTLKH